MKITVHSSEAMLCSAHGDLMPTRNLTISTRIMDWPGLKCLSGGRSQTTLDLFVLRLVCKRYLMLKVHDVVLCLLKL